MFLFPCFFFFFFFFFALTEQVEEAHRGERQAINTRVQGSAADLLKRAMLALSDEEAKRIGMRLLLQVHDELIFEVDADPVALNRAARYIQEKMESALALDLPLPVRLSCGPRFGSLAPMSTTLSM
jgi:DNA polymerase I-like protein with 3'-5' exonuclease and polymerase domains